VYIHTTASWPAREDRRTALVWLGIFWIFVGVGFGFDLHNYLREQPAVPKIVHVHAIATTLWLLTATALVLMVETGNVRFHRRFGWFAAGYAALIVVIAPWSELSWQALNLKTPGSLPPEFLSIAFSGVICMIVLLPWGILLRRRSSARAHSGYHLHQRCGLFPNGGPLSACTNYLSRHLPVLRGRQSAPHPSHVSLGLEMQPDNETVPMGSLLRHCCRPGGHRPLLQRDVEIDLALVAGGLGAEHAVEPRV
jgi:hypothetical protein